MTPEHDKPGTHEISTAPDGVAARSETGGPLSHRLAKGVAWISGGRLSVRLIDFISMIVLARILTPSDFGLVALATTFLAMIDLMTALGTDASLIRYQDADRSFYDTAWTLSIIRGLFVAAAIVTTADVAASFFDETRLRNVLYWMAFAVLLAACQNVAIINFTKHLNFRNEAFILLSEKLTVFASTVASATVLRTYWALVIGVISGGFARFLLSYAMIKFRPRLSVRRWRQILGFGVWTLISGMTGFLGHRAPAFFLAKMIDANAVGVFTMSCQIAGLATTELMTPIQRVVFPGYAQIATDLERLRKAYLRFFALTLMVAGPAAAGIALVAEPLILAVLGDGWRGAIPMVSALAIFSFLQITVTASAGLYMALGRPHITAYMGLGFGILTVPLLYAFIRLYGTIGAAYTMTCIALLYTVLDLYIANRILRLTMKRIIIEVWRPLLSTILMGILLLCIDPAVIRVLGTNPVVDLAALIVFGVSSYLALLFCLWRVSGAVDGAERFLIDCMTQAMKGARIVTQQARFLRSLHDATSYCRSRIRGWTRRGHDLGEGGRERSGRVRP